MMALLWILYTYNLIVLGVILLNAYWLVDMLRNELNVAPTNKGCTTRNIYSIIVKYISGLIFLYLLPLFVLSIKEG